MTETSRGGDGEIWFPRVCKKGLAAVLASPGGWFRAAGAGLAALALAPVSWWALGYYAAGRGFRIGDAAAAARRFYGLFLGELAAVAALAAGGAWCASRIPAPAPGTVPPPGWTDVRLYWLGWAGLTLFFALVTLNAVILGIDRARPDLPRRALGAAALGCWLGQGTQILLLCALLAGAGVYADAHLAGFVLAVRHYIRFNAEQPEFLLGIVRFRCCFAVLALYYVGTSVHILEQAGAVLLRGAAAVTDAAGPGRDGRGGAIGTEEGEERL